MTNVATTLLLVVGIINAIVAVSVFMRASASNIRYTFLILTLAVSMWAWGIVLFTVANSVENAQLFVNTYYTAALAIGSALLVFGLRLNGFATRAKIAASYAPVVVLALVLFVFEPTWLIRVASLKGALSERIDIMQPSYSIYGLVFLTLFLLGVGLMYRMQRAQHGRSRKRQQVVTAGVVIAGVFGMIFNLIMPWAGNYEFITAGPIFSILFTASVTYAIVKYSLFDLRQTFIVTLGYILTGIAAAFVYTMAIWTVGAFVAMSTTNANVTGVIYIGLALVVALTINPLREFFDRVTSKLFLRERYNPEAALDSFGDAILNDVDIKSIFEKATAGIDSVMHPSFIAMALVNSADDMVINEVHCSNPKRQSVIARLSEELYIATVDTQAVATDSLARDSGVITKIANANISIVSRMELKNQLVGYLLVGEKRNGRAYGASEIHMLSTMSDELALVVVNSLRFDEIQKFNARLKYEISTATKELRRSNKKLLELDATKDEFVSMASHQLRTPLTSVKGYISMVLEGDAGEITSTQRQLLSEAYASSERMVHLIGDFLNVSRLQTGKFIVERRELDLAKMVQQEVESMTPIAATHSVALKFKKPSRFPMLYLDEGKLRQVVMNFIDNAIYYSPDTTSVTIKLSVEEGNVVFEVQDKGMGVPPEVQSHLFTKFFRAENARKQRPDGTGIGLYLAKRIIDAHDGKIIFESQLGKGSTFGFRLPIKKLSRPPVEVEMPQESSVS